jgi:hypothetical protein
MTWSRAKGHKCGRGSRKYLGKSGGGGQREQRWWEEGHRLAQGGERLGSQEKKVRCRRGQDKTGQQAQKKKKKRKKRERETDWGQ